MFTPRLDPSPGVLADEPNEPEGADTALIRQLAGAFFTGAPAPTAPTPPLPAATTPAARPFPGVHPEPAPFAFPSGGFSAFAPPEIPAPLGASSPALPGGVTTFSATPLDASAVSPVLPTEPPAAPSTPAAPPITEVTPRVIGVPATAPMATPAAESTPPPVHPATIGAPSTSAHDPGSADSFPFGEPRGDFLGSRPTGTAFAPPAAPAPAPAPAPNAAPEFYFLPATPAPAPADAAPLSGVPRGTRNPPLSAFNVETVRRDFPALHQSINGHPLVFLDNAATTQKPQAVIDATAHFYARDNSNIHRAGYQLAERATAAFENGRERVREFAGDKHEIVFLRGTTEAINLVAQSFGRANIGEGDEIIFTELEHHANIVPWQLLARQVGATIRVIPIDDRGELLLDAYVKLLGPRTKIVSVAHVSNSLGTVNPVELIIQLAHAHGVPVLIDGAQSTPHLPVNVLALDADFYVFSGHKVFGPSGIGALYGKAPLLEAMPPWQGGGHMIRDVRFERTVFQSAPEKFEAGTPDIAGVVGLAAAIEYLFQVGIPSMAAYKHALLEYAAHALATVPGLRPIGTAATKASVLSFVIPGIPTAEIAKHLDARGIAVRAGHHCALPAIRHYGLESSVRASLAFYNPREEVDALVAALHQLPRR